MNLRVSTTALILLALLLASLSKVQAAEIEDKETIGLFGDEQPAVRPSPIPRPTSKIAENVTVITADDIARLNAHTVAEVLQTVPGIQLDFNPRTPTGFTFFNIEGALNSTVLILIDGVRQNDYDQNMISPGLIPVQQIERIEIVKGAASGAWGSALGGVVNIVTKNPNPEAAISGVASLSLGGHLTSEERAELTGTEKGLGYYLAGGHLRSDGLSPNTATNAGNAYGKISYTLPGEGVATLGVSHVEADGGLGEGFGRGKFYKQEGDSRHDYGFLKYQQPLPNKLTLDFSAYLRDFEDSVSDFVGDSAGNIMSGTFPINDNSGGINSSITWGESGKNVVAGWEYAHVHARSSAPSGLDVPTYNRSWDSLAAYCNATYSIGRLAILPGVRFDSTGIAGDHTSYTLGLTYQLAAETTLRAYAAQGFSLPMLSLDKRTGAQKIRTIQGGIESGAIPFLWLKGTYFLNALRDSESVGPAASATVTDQERQGFELEARTTPLFGFSLQGGYTYLYAEDESNGKRLQTNGEQSVPPQVYKVGVRYDNSRLGLRGTLTGSGVDWNASYQYPARAKGMIWDLNLNWKLARKGPFSTELFFTAHNLFDGIQTTNTVMQTVANRWFEGGARFHF